MEHPLNRDYEDFPFFEPPSKHRSLTTYRFRSKIQETSLGRDVHCTAKVSDSIHLRGLSAILHRASVKIGLRFPHFPLCIYHQLPDIRYRRSIHLSLRVTHRHFPTTSRELSNLYPRRYPVLAYVRIPRVYSAINARIETSQFWRGIHVAQRASENAESFGLKAPDNQTKRNGTKR